MAARVVLGSNVPQHRVWVQPASAQGTGTGCGDWERQVVQQHPIFPGLSPSASRTLQRWQLRQLSAARLCQRAASALSPDGGSAVGWPQACRGVGQHTQRDPTALGQIMNCSCVARLRSFPSVVDGGSLQSKSPRGHLCGCSTHGVRPQPAEPHSGAPVWHPD